MFVYCDAMQAVLVVNRNRAMLFNRIAHIRCARCAPVRVQLKLELARQHARDATETVAAASTRCKSVIQACLQFCGAIRD